MRKRLRALLAAEGATRMEGATIMRGKRYLELYIAEVMRRKGNSYINEIGPRNKERVQIAVKKRSEQGEVKKWEVAIRMQVLGPQNAGIPNRVIRTKSRGYCIQSPTATIWRSQRHPLKFLFSQL